MATVIACPFCQRSLHLPEETLARPVQCPGCGGTFQTARSALSEGEGEGQGTRARAALPKLVVEEAEMLSAPIRGLPPPPEPLRPVLVSSSHDAGEPGQHGAGAMGGTTDSDEPGGMERCRNCRART